MISTGRRISLARIMPISWEEPSVVKEVNMVSRMCGSVCAGPCVIKFIDSCGSYQLEWSWWWLVLQKGSHNVQVTRLCCLSERRALVLQKQHQKNGQVSGLELAKVRVLKEILPPAEA